MPTFVFLRNKIKIDTLKGSNPAALEEKIKQWYSEEEGEEEEPAVKGHVSRVISHPQRHAKLYRIKCHVKAKVSY